MQHITPETKVADLLATHPELERFLTTYHPLFRGLDNPLLRRTIGKVATLKRAASMAKLSVERLIVDIESELARRAGGVAPRSGEVPPPSSGSGGSPLSQKEQLKQIIAELHAGGDKDDLQRRFDALAIDLSATEIAALEQELVGEGLPESEIQALCDVHARMLGGAIPSHGEVTLPPAGHPAHSLHAENDALEEQAAALVALLDSLDDPLSGAALAAHRNAIDALLVALETVELHYQRKENQLFPFLERHGITAPPQVMWAVHDDIRALLVRTREALDNDDAEGFSIASRLFVDQLREMIHKEETILLPLCLDTLDDDEWGEIQRGEASIGFALVEPGSEWVPGTDPAEGAAAVGTPVDLVALDTGTLTPLQVRLLLNHLPVDITFVDEHDEVRFYSDTKHRVFPRSPGIIGRKVQKCHPPKSVHIVERILASFRAGDKDVASFWIALDGRFLFIRYFALRDPLGIYRGCLEVMEDATEVRSLEGQRRLLDW